MNIEKLKAAEREAIEFLKRAKVLRQAEPNNPYFWASKYSGAVRRQSMELTRALAALRKPN